MGTFRDEYAMIFALLIFIVLWHRLVQRFYVFLRHLPYKPAKLIGISYYVLEPSRQDAMFLLRLNAVSMIKEDVRTDIR